MDPGLDRPNTGIRGSNDAHVMDIYVLIVMMAIILPLNILEKDCLWGGMDWVHPAENTDQWRALVNTVMNLRIP
jgi:hypothetical protein